MTFLFDGDGYLRAADAQAQGVSRRELDRAVAEGDLARICPGVFAPAAERSPSARHRLMALGSEPPDRAAISHSSAAVLHGLAMLSPDLSRLHLTSTTTDHGYRRAHRYLHPGPLPDSDITTVRGVPATTLERTAFDVARTSRWGFAGALAILDSTLRAGGDRHVMERYGSVPRIGVGRARKALIHADGLSENPGESWSRAQLIAAGLPIPRLQTEIFDAYGDFVARSDFDWVDDDGRIRVVGEFDGLGKYLKYLAPGEDVDAALRREKEREGRLQDLGILVVRWIWADLKVPGLVPDRVRKHLELARLL